MKRRAASTLLVACAAAACLLFSQHAAPDEQLRAMQGQNRVTETSVNVIQQNRCAEQAQEEFHRLAEDLEKGAFVADNYNEGMKRCFIEIGGGGDDSVFTFRSLVDERGREYADYIEYKNTNAAASQVSSAICEIILESGEVMECRSLDEFDEIIKDYMK